MNAIYTYGNPDGTNGPSAPVTLDEAIQHIRHFPWPYRRLDDSELASSHSDHTPPQYVSFKIGHASCAAVQEQDGTFECVLLIPSPLRRFARKLPGVGRYVTNGNIEKYPHIDAPRLFSILTAMFRGNHDYAKQIARGIDTKKGKRTKTPLIILLPIPEDLDMGVLSPTPKIRMSPEQLRIVMLNIGGETRCDLEKRFPGLLEDFRATLPNDGSGLVLQWTYVGRNADQDILRFRDYAKMVWEKHSAAAVVECRMRRM